MLGSGSPLRVLPSPLLPRSAGVRSPSGPLAGSLGLVLFGANFWAL